MKIAEEKKIFFFNFSLAFSAKYLDDHKGFKVTCSALDYFFKVWLENANGSEVRIHPSNVVLDSSGENCVAQYQFVSKGVGLNILKKAIYPHDLTSRLVQNGRLHQILDMLDPIKIEYLERKSFCKDFIYR